MLAKFYSEYVLFEKVRIFVEFFYHMYKSFDFHFPSIAKELKGKHLSQTNFKQNSLQYCVSYHSNSRKENIGRIEN